MQTAINTAIDNALFDKTYGEFSYKDSWVETKTAYTIKVAQKALDTLYHPVEVNRPVNLVVRWIEPGGPITGEAQGLGDMSHALKTVKLLKTEFPTANIFLANKFYDAEEVLTTIERNNWERKLPSQKADELFLGIFAPESLPGYIKANYPNTPTIMLDVATPDTTVWPFTLNSPDKRKDDCVLDSSFHIDEYNGNRTNECKLQDIDKHAWYSSGIGSDQRLKPCVGIHLNDLDETKKPTPAKLLASLQDKDFSLFLKKHLFRSNKKEELYFGYHSEDDPGHGQRYMNAVIYYEINQKVKRDIDFVFLTQNNDEFDLDWWKTHFPLLWKNTSLKALEITEAQVNNGKTTKIALNKNGTQTIRVLNWQKKIPSVDVKLMMKASGVALLVTGDQSFSEALSFKDKVIFYEKREWKRDFAEEMTRHAAHWFGKLSKIHKFMEYMNTNATYVDSGRTWLSDFLGGLLSEKTFLEQHQKYVLMIRERYNMVPWLVGKIKRRVINYYLPQISPLESAFVNEFFQGNDQGAKLKAIEIAQWAGSNMPGTPPLTRKRKREAEAHASLEVKKVKAVISPFRQNLVEKVDRVFKSILNGSK